MTKAKKLLIFRIVALTTAMLIATYCFMIKLPAPFRKMDTELHATFFFSASAFINILFAIKTVRNHLLVFGMLFLFGSLIEFAQEYSNSFFKHRIHGNFDPIDLKYNLTGICLFSLLWLLYFITRKLKKSIS